MSALTTEPNVIFGYGFTLSYKDLDASGVPTGSANILDFCEEAEPPETEFEDVDTSHAQSADRHRTFKPGWANGGEARFTAKSEKAGIAALITIADARASKEWTLEFVDGSKVVFKGYIKRRGTPLDVQGLVKLTFTIKVSGKPVFTAAA